MTRAQDQKRESMGKILAQTAPVLAALLYIVIKRMQTNNVDTWPGYLAICGSVLIAGLPILGAHAVAATAPLRLSLTVWVTLVLGSPFLVLVFGLSAFTLDPVEWTLVALVSALSLLVVRSMRVAVSGVLERLPITLDGVVILLLVLWTLAMTSLLSATPNALDNQPLDTFFDGDRMLANPLMVLAILVQLAAMALLVFGYYCVFKHVLVRRILPRFGWLAFISASLVFWMIMTPVTHGIALLLPINGGEMTLLPSENRNPFETVNYQVSFSVAAVFVLLSLASERLLADSRKASSMHAAIRAELDVLHQQINPHFLFNTLNTLYSLCLRDRKSSAEAVAKLSDLLRYSVYETREQWVPLSGEVEHLENYLELQMLRFGKRCTVSTNWPEKVEGWCVPPQAMIMLVENAFKHGVEQTSEQSTVVINLQSEGERMTFTCLNSPAGEAPGTSGLGLANLQRRLELLADEGFELVSSPDGGKWRATLSLDMRPC